VLVVTAAAEETVITTTFSRAAWPTPHSVDETRHSWRQHGITSHQQWWNQTSLCSGSQ